MTEPAWPVIHLERVGSTNDEARARLLAGLPPPFVIYAEEQTAGRGRGTRRWWSDSGSLTVSLALDPDRFGIQAEQANCMSLALAVATIEAIDELAPGLALTIRWPNDIEAAGRKLGGILPEVVPIHPGSALVVGIGLNVATRIEDAPPEIRTMATSLSALAPDRRLGRMDVLRALLPRAERILQALGRRDASLAGRWQDLDALRGQPVRIDTGGRILAGIARGIEPDGSLILETPSGIVPVRGGQVLREKPRP